MVIQYPWTGRDWNRAISISGRAAMPGLPGGSGFNFRSVAGTTGLLRPGGMNGLGRMRRLIGIRRRGFRGLGQPDPTSVDTTSTSPGDYLSSIGLSTTGCGPGSFQVDAAGNCFDPSNPNNILLGGSSSQSRATTTSSILQSLIGVGSQITNYELNPLTNKSTYISTPSGQVVATNQPVTGITATNVGTQLSTTGTVTGSSLFPLLMLGGAAVVFMMMMSRR